MQNFSSRSIWACLLPTVIAVLSVYWFRKKRKLKKIDDCMKLQKPAMEPSQTECQNHGTSESSESECQTVGTSRSSQIECQSFSMSGTALLPKQSDIISDEKAYSSVDEDVKINSTYDSNISDEATPLSVRSTTDCPASTENTVESVAESKCNGFINNQDSNCNHTLNVHTTKNTDTKVQNELNHVCKETTEPFNDSFLEAELTIIYDSTAEVIPKESICESETDVLQSISSSEQQPIENVQTEISNVTSLPTDNQNDNTFSDTIDNIDSVDTKDSNSAEFGQMTNSPVSNPSDCDFISSVGTSSISLNEFASTSPLNSPHEQSSILNDSAIGDEEDLSIDSGNCSIRGSICRSSASHDLESHADIKHLTDTMLESSNASASSDQNSEPVKDDHKLTELCSDGLNCEPDPSPHQQDADAQSEVNDKANSHAVAKSYENRYVYEFELPYELCGRLIGRQGKFIKHIKEITRASACLKRHPYSDGLKLVTLEGSRFECNQALDIIRRRFPLVQFPALTLAQTNVPVDALNVPEPLQLHLPEGVAVDVILSSMVTAGHFFLQQPTHPTYPSLSTLDQCMLTCYTQAETPALPGQIDAGVICAATIMGGWYRAQVMYVFENGEQCEIKYVDYGGYSHVPSSSLRQIRSDFMTLPFQASECYLANVQPVNAEVGWTPEAAAVFEELAQGQILQALVVNFHEDGTPQVHLYRVQGITSTFINRELVSRGMAKWVENR